MTFHIIATDWCNKCILMSNLGKKRLNANSELPFGKIALSKPVLGTSANRSANPQIAGSRFWFTDLQTDFLPQTLQICGKKLKSTANQQHHRNRFCNFQKNTFLQIQ